MDNKMQLSAQQSTQLPMASLREQSVSTILEAIRLPHDSGETLRRVNAVLGQYYDPAFDPETKALVREEFVRALMPYPMWAVHKAFDEWVRAMQRRPSPGEIVILIGRAMKPLTDEVARREKERREMERAKRDAGITPEEMEKRRQFAEYTLAKFGFESRAPLVDKGNPIADVTPDEIAETLAMVNANAAIRETERQRRADVASDLERRGLGNNATTA